jgi:hypothetical protein
MVPDKPENINTSDYVRPGEPGGPRANASAGAEPVDLLDPYLTLSHRPARDPAADLAKFFEYMRPSGGSVIEVRAIPRVKGHGRVQVGLFTQKEEFCRECTKANRLEFNLYVGISGRNPDVLDRAPNVLMPGVSGATNTDVVPPYRMLVDIDADTDRRREAKKSDPTGSAAATEAEIAVVAEVTLGVLQDPILAGVQPGLVFSGNGFGLHVPLLVPPEHELDDIGIRMKLLGNLLRSRHARAGTKIDATFDLARITALPGTVKRKGSDSSRHRMVRLLRLPDGAVDLGALDVEVPTRSTESKEPRTSPRDERDSARFPEIPSDEAVQPLLYALERRCPAAAYICREVEEQPGEGRSGVLYHLAGLLRCAGMADDDVVKLLIWHDNRCGRKFVGRAYPGWSDYVDALLIAAAHYQAHQRTVELRLLGNRMVCKKCRTASSQDG